MSEGTTIPMPATFDEVFIDGKVECFSWSKWTEGDTQKEMTVGTVVFSELYCSPSAGMRESATFSFKNINNTIILARNVRILNPDDNMGFITLSEIKPGVAYQYTATSVESNPPGLY